jgi:hypothetical protein
LASLLVYAHFLSQPDEYFDSSGLIFSAMIFERGEPFVFDPGPTPTLWKEVVMAQGDVAGLSPPSSRC